MAVRILRALLAAQTRQAWNRVRSESGLAGPVATAGVLGIVALVLAVPCLLMLVLGLDLGRELRTAPDATVLLHWNGMQALFTVGFAVLGSLRYKPTFTLRELGWFPIPPLQLLAAEIPASLFEVFPLLGTAGIVFSNLGLAVRMPAAAPLVGLLAVQGIVAMQALLFLAAGARRSLTRRRLWLVLAGLGALAAVFQLGAEGLRDLLRSALPALIPWLPGSQGYAGLLDLGSGHVPSALARLAAALGATAALLMLAARVHQRQLTAESAAPGSRRGAPRALRFRRPAAGIGRLFHKQLLDSKVGRILLVLPLLLTAPTAVVLWAVRFDAARDRILEELVGSTERFEQLPLLAILLFLVVTCNSQVWMNQFGWDRRGVHTLLLLPIAPRDLLVGKLAGLLRFTALQALIGVVPLLSVYRPALPEVLTGIAGAGVALLATAGAGHFFSARFPRAVARDGGATLPLYLTWVPTVLILGLAGAVVGVHEMAEGWGRWTPPAALLALLGGAVVVYVVALPALAEQVRRHRERLLQM